MVLPEHLEPAADSEHGTAGRRMGGDGAIKTSEPKPREVGDRGPRPRQHEEIHAGDRARIGEPRHLDARLETEGVDVGEVADPREPHDADCQRPVPTDIAALTARCEVEGVLGVEPDVGAPRKNAVRRAPGQFGQPLNARLEKVVVTAELVDDEPGDQTLVVRIQECDRAEKRCENTAAVDVSHDDDWHVRVPSEAHVRVVASTKVDLGRASRALADHDVEARRKIVEGGERGGGEVRPAADEFRRRDRASRLTVDHDVAAAGRCPA